MTYSVLIREKPGFTVKHGLDYTDARDLVRKLRSNGHDAYLQYEW